MNKITAEILIRELGLDALLKPRSTAIIYLLSPDRADLIMALTRPGTTDGNL